MRLMGNILVILSAICSIAIVWSLVSWNKKHQVPAEGSIRVTFFTYPWTGPDIPDRTLTPDEAEELRSMLQQLTPVFFPWFRTIPDFYTIYATAPDGATKEYTVYLNDNVIYQGDFIDGYVSGLMGYRLSEADRKTLQKIIWERPSGELKSKVTH